MSIYRRYRANLNNSLQKCKTMEEFEEALEAFRNEFPYPLEMKTEKNHYETFSSLAGEHRQRIESAILLDFHALSKSVSDLEGFEILEQLYFDHDFLQTGENESLIDTLGKELNAYGY